MKKGIKYERYSADEQSQHSFERQDIDIDPWAERNNVLITDTFRDKGISARTFNRLEVQRLFSFLKKNHRRVDFLLVSDLSRFSRDAGPAIQMVQSIQMQYDIRIVSCRRGMIYDVMDSNSFFIMGLEFLQATSENIKRQADINGGIYAAKTVKGKWIQGGPAPFGYVKVQHGKERIMQVNEGQAQVIRFIYDAFLSGISITEIEKQARVKGFTKKGSDPVGELIRNPLYMSFQQVKPYNGKPGGLFPIKDLPPIISPEKWYTAQRLFKRPDRARVSVTDDFPLRGILHCECGKLLTAAKSTGRAGKKYGFYKCNESRHLNLSSTIAHDKLDKIWQYLSIPADVVRQVETNSYTMLEERMKEERAEAVKKQKQLELVQRNIESLEKKFIADQINFETYNRWLSDYSQQRDALHYAVESSKQDSEALMDLLRRNVEKLTDLQYVYRESDTTGKQMLLRGVFDNTLTYKKDGYRTAYLPRFLWHNLLILKHKGLLVYDNLTSNPGEVEATGAQSNRIVSVFDIMHLFDKLKIA